MLIEKDELTTPLDAPDSHYCRAAQGWIELGDLEEAKCELLKVHEAHVSHPDVLEVKWSIESQAGEWGRCVDLGEQIVQKDPVRTSGWIYRSFALHELKKTEEAWERLLPAMERFPTISTIPYNLACYACQLGKLDTARAMLVRAFQVDEGNGLKGQHAMLALADPDLAPLWNEIEGFAKRS